MKKEDDQFLLAVYDISGIQEYIFASNRLRENIGGSYIVGSMMRTHFPKVLKQVASERNGEVMTDWEKAPFRLFDYANALAEVIYIGGGNALAVYRDWKLYNEVNKQFSLAVIQESYTLTLVTEVIAFSLSEGNSYDHLVKRLMEKLDRTKSEIIRSKPLGTLPIFTQERFGGWPVTSVDKNANDEEVSTEQALKRKEALDRSPQELFPLPDKYKSLNWAKEMEDMKRKKGEDSYVAVVHIDGNGMGQWLRKELHNLKDKPIAEQIEHHRKLSKQITSRYSDQFTSVINELSFKSKDSAIPIRPLILDGDDVTFICRADWGIPLAQAFLRRLEKDSAEYPISACAGIALVHSHFPFQIAYEIAEECCQTAKKKYYENKQGSYLDFHLVRGSYVQTRQEQLSQGLNRKQQRPYQVKADCDRKDINSIDALAQVIHKMKQTPDQLQGAWPRSRLVRLYQAYLQTDEAAHLVKEEAASRGYSLSYFMDEIQPIDEAQESDNEVDGLLFDALELLESYECDLFEAKEEKHNERI